MKRGKDQIFVLTGATGFLGSHLMASLLELGHVVVVLGRPAGQIGLAERIARLLAWFGLENRKTQVEIIEVDPLRPFLGLEQHMYQALCTKKSQIIHCASDTRFSERNRLESIRTNVHSLKGMIGFAKESKASFFHYVSTAYVAGRTVPLCREALVHAGEFANIYEETKAQAEKEVAARCSSYGIPFSILRPSIVYGDSRSGRANCFNALYYHVKSLYYIREIYLNDIRNHGGGKSREYGIHLDSKRILHIPLKIFLTQRGFVNLIPIDYFVSTAISILKQAEPGNVYHITSDAPKTTEELASYCERFLKIKGLEIVYGNSSDETSLNPPEALFNRFIEPYRPYLSDTRIFERNNANRALTALSPPELTYDIFERCMDYAVSVNWGNEKTSQALTGVPHMVSRD